MAERPDLERYVDDESRRVLREQSRFARRPTPVRVLIVVAVATLFLLAGAAFVLVLDHRHGGGASPVVVGGLVAWAVVVYAVALARAVAPERAARRAARQQGSYPTRAPGYARRFGD